MTKYVFRSKTKAKQKQRKASGGNILLKSKHKKSNQNSRFRSEPQNDIYLAQTNRKQGDTASRKRAALREHTEGA